MKKSNSTKSSNACKPLLANRLFKFRAFVRSSFIVPVINIDFNNEFITWDDNQFDRSIPPNKCYEIERLEDIALMQFTGLKDKNGVDIYEGDIFNCNKVNYILRFLTIGGAYTVHKIIDETDERFLFHCNEQIEVIGNVFENSELLADSN